MDTTEESPLYMISVVASMLGIHPQTLRLYEREQLIKPQRTGGNTRLYSENDIERVKQIMTLTRDLGVNLAGVEIILNMKDQIEELKNNFSEFVSFIQEELNKEFAGFEEKFNQALVKAPHQQVIGPGLIKEKK